MVTKPTPAASLGPEETLYLWKAAGPGIAACYQIARSQSVPRTSQTLIKQTNLFVCTQDFLEVSAMGTED